MAWFKGQCGQIGLFGCGQFSQLDQRIAPVVVGGRACFLLVGRDGLPIIASTIPGVAAPYRVAECAGCQPVLSLQIGLHGLLVW